MLLNIKPKYSNDNTQLFYWLLLSGFFLLSLIFHKFAAIYIGLASILLFLIANRNVVKDIYAILLSKPIQLFFGLWAWAGFSLFWTTNFENGANTWVKMLAIVFFLILLFSSIKALDENKLKKIIQFSLLTSFGTIAFYITIKPFNIVIDKSLASFFALIFFSIFGFVLRNKKSHSIIIAAIYYFLAIYAIKHSGTQTTFYGFALGGAVFLLTLYKAKITSLVLKYASFLFILLSPSLSYFLLETPQRLLPYMDKSLTSFFHRLCIWSFVSNKIVEKPLLGWGLGSSKHFTGGNGYFFQNVPASEEPYLKLLYGLLGKNPTYLTNLPVHPHNNPLQIFFELGFPGGLIYAFLIATIFKIIQTTFQDKIVLASANALATLTFVICNMSHSAWHIWLLSWIFLSFGLLYAVHRLTLLEKQNQNL